MKSTIHVHGCTILYYNSYHISCPTIFHTYIRSILDKLSNTFLFELKLPAHISTFTSTNQIKSARMVRLQPSTTVITVVNEMVSNTTCHSGASCIGVMQPVCLHTARMLSSFSPACFKGPAPRSSHILLLFVCAQML